MARRILATQDVDLRARMAEHLGELIATYAPASSAPSCPWPRFVAAIEAGRPVTFYGWQLAHAGAKVGPGGRYVLEADGTLTVGR